VACSLGIALAGIIQTALVALGLGKIMEAWPLVANVIRWVGALYLAALGISLLKSWWLQRRSVDQAQTHVLLDRSIMNIFLAGVANNLLNPKALLFFSVFLPQFVNPDLGPSSTQIAILGLMLTAIALLYNLAITIAFSQIRHLDLGHGMIARNGQGLVGVLFVLLAGRLAASKTV
jgi:threonine/homoserine/homoserine lactone efflux protein